MVAQRTAGEKSNMWMDAKTRLPPTADHLHHAGGDAVWRACNAGAGRRVHNRNSLGCRSNGRRLVNFESIIVHWRRDVGGGRSQGDRFRLELML